MGAKLFCEDITECVILGGIEKPGMKPGRQAKDDGRRAESGAGTERLDAAAGSEAAGRDASVFFHDGKRAARVAGAAGAGGGAAAGGVAGDAAAAAGSAGRAVQ